MRDDPDHSEEVRRADEDNARAKDARRVVEEYADGLRDMLHKLRKWLN